jgi:hypothetical protein
MYAYLQGRLSEVGCIQRRRREVDVARVGLEKHRKRDLDPGDCVHSP